MYSKGTTLKIDFVTFYHYGIADGMGGVVHNSKKRLMVTHESEADFAEGKEILISDITSDNPSYALEKAKRYINMPYYLAKQNCEHFVRLCHGLDVESLQIKKYLLVGVLAGIAYKSKNPIIKSAGAAGSITALCTSREKSPFRNAAIAVLITAGVAYVIS